MEILMVLKSLSIPIIIGLVAGVASGLFGIGGGVIIVPLLLYIYKFKQHSATATSLIALVLPVGAFGIWQYYKMGHIQNENIKVGLLIALGMFLGAFYGAKIAEELRSEYLTKAFAVFLVIIAIRLWFKD